jgi:hypothetical protein
MVHARNGSRASLRVLPPFIHFHGQTQSQEAEAAFEKAKTQSMKCQI